MCSSSVSERIHLPNIRLPSINAGEELINGGFGGGSDEFAVKNMAGVTARAEMQLIEDAEVEMDVAGGVRLS
jgi:hypothetical protein